MLRLHQQTGWRDEQEPFPNPCLHFSHTPAPHDPSSRAMSWQTLRYVTATTRLLALADNLALSFHSTCSRTRSPSRCPRTSTPFSLPLFLNPNLYSARVQLGTCRVRVCNFAFTAAHPFPSPSPSLSPSLTCRVHVLRSHYGRTPLSFPFPSPLTSLSLPLWGTCVLERTEVVVSNLLLQWNHRPTPKSSNKASRTKYAAPTLGSCTS